VGEVRGELQPVVFDQSSALDRGRAHGELWRAEIHALAAIRLELCLRGGSFDGVEQLLELARLHVPVLREHAPDLHDELLGIAQGADLAVDRLVVLNHYAALRGPSPHVSPRVSAEADAGGCTAIYTHGEDGPLLGQTWDMHADAMSFVRTIAIRPGVGRRETLCFTLTGCLGLAGLGHAGVAVTVNDLSVTDGQVGLLWPAVVRQVLDAPNADVGLARLRAAKRSGGHHFMIADGERFYGVECSGELAVLTQKGARAAHLHTNHCFDPVLRQRERVSPRSSTFHRLNMATTLYAQQRPTTFEALWALLGSHDGEPRSICSHLTDTCDDPAAPVTCGRILMRPADRALRVAWGCSRDGESLDLRLAVS
jgi:isopenicillin-N N-acyltransferase like protein